MTHQRNLTEKKPLFSRQWLSLEILGSTVTWNYAFIRSPDNLLCFAIFDYAKRRSLGPFDIKNFAELRQKEQIGLINEVFARFARLLNHASQRTSISMMGEWLSHILVNYPPRCRYLVGVSGGLDSVALLRLLVQAGYKRLVICHLDHGLRGTAAKADARFVERLAARWDLSAVIGRANVKAAARAEKQSIETAARAARMRFFADTARRQRCRTLFLAHHADDQVETSLFNLFRGSGAAGLGGMKVESLRAMEPPARGKLRVVRPLLGVWRAELEEYARNEGLSWREDASNADPAHTRNRLRHEIIPMLETAFGRDIRAAILRAADVLGAEDAWMADLLAAELGEYGLESQLRVKKLLVAPVAKQRRLLRAWLASQKVAQIGYETVERVRALLDIETGPAKVNLPGDRHARRRAGVIFIERASNQSQGSAR